MSPPDTPPSGDDPGVLSGLSRTRPQRRSNKRPGRQPQDADASAPRKAAASTKTAARKVTPRSAPTAAKNAAPKKTAPAKPATRKAGTTRPAVEVGRVAEPRPEPVTAAPAQAGGVDIVGQAIQAAGEVAQLGVGIGRQVAKGILSRLPKP